MAKYKKVEFEPDNSGGYGGRNRGSAFTIPDITSDLSNSYLNIVKTKMAMDQQKDERMLRSVTAIDSLTGKLFANPDSQKEWNNILAHHKVPEMLSNIDFSDPEQYRNLLRTLSRVNNDPAAKNILVHDAIFKQRSDQLFKSAEALGENFTFALEDLNASAKNPYDLKSISNFSPSNYIKMDVPGTINKLKEQYITTQHEVKPNDDGSESIYLTTGLDKAGFTAALEQQIKLDGAFANNLKMNARRNGVTPDMNAIVADIAATSATPASRVIETKNWDETSKLQYADLKQKYEHDTLRFPLEIARLDLTNDIATIEKDMAKINLEYLPQEKKMKYDQDVEQLKIIKANAKTQEDMNIAQLNQMRAQTQLIKANTAATLDETKWKNAYGWRGSNSSATDPTVNPIIATLANEGRIEVSNDVAHGTVRTPSSYNLYAEKADGSILNLSSEVVFVDNQYTPHFGSDKGETNLTYNGNTGFANYEVFLTKSTTGDLTIEKYENEFNKKYNAGNRTYGKNRLKAEGGVIYFLDVDPKDRTKSIPIPVGTYDEQKRDIGKNTRKGIAFRGQGMLSEYVPLYSKYYNKKK